MLKNLHIQNYALIENLDIDFESGFSVITGETGAGKSILLGALSLVLGARADIGAISTGAKKCTAEATFSVSGLHVEQFFNDNDLDLEDCECIIRRELTSAGKSRAFINDTPVSLSVVKELSKHLIDIHSQHQNLLLSDTGFQLDAVDSVANNAETMAEYTRKYHRLREAERELGELQDKVNNDNSNSDYLQFQLNELSAAQLTDGEQEELEEEQLILDNAENIKDAIYSATNSLGDIADKLYDAGHALERIGAVYPNAVPYTERIESCKIELGDISSDLAYKLSEVDFDPQRADIVAERLNTIYSLQKKYHKQTVAELLLLQENISQELNCLNNSEEILAEKKKQCDALRKEAKVIAKELSLTRKEAAGVIEKSIMQQLQSLGMPNVVFRVDLSPSDKLSATGCDEVAMMFSSNKNVPACNIAKIASGGEIARVMLSLKALLSHHKELPTIIFDEIDTGVSGKISDKMSSVMNDMAQQGHQVVCITHQPQIAANGQVHYRVFKEDSQHHTHTHIERLTPQQRIEEIAKMLSGETLTEAAISNAKTLLKL